MDQAKKEVKPIVVALGDVHFRMDTLELASAAVRAGRAKAAELGVPLLLNGDTLDGKAIVRGECMNRLIQIMQEPNPPPVTIVNKGNHDALNERSSEHSLGFLAPYVAVVDEPRWFPDLGWILPYFSDPNVLLRVLEALRADRASLVFVHQGVMTADMGSYCQDKTSLDPAAYAGFRTIGSHYHKKQDIVCPLDGLFSYIGSPYTISFTEAKDGPKGYTIVYSDGSLELVPLALRKHVIVERTADTVMEPIPDLNPDDLLWLKVSGPYSALQKLNKRAIGLKHLGHLNFKFDRIETERDKSDDFSKANLTNAGLLDKIVDSTSESAGKKESLKSLWREVLGT